MTSNTYNYVDDLLEGMDIPADQEARINARVAEMVEADHALKNLRKQLGISQNDVADAMGVSKSSVNQLEARNLRNAKLDTLVRYFEGCGYNLELTLTPID